MNRNKTKVRKAFDNLPTTPPLGVNIVQFETLVIESPRLKQFHFEKKYFESNAITSEDGSVLIN